MARVDSWLIGGSAMPMVPRWVVEKRVPTTFALDGTPKFQGKDRGQLIFDGLTQAQYTSLWALLSNTTTSVATTITVPNDSGTFTTYDCIALRPQYEEGRQTQGVRLNVSIDVIELSET